MKLFSGRLSMFGAKVEIALREKGVEFEVEMVPFDFGAGYSPKHPDVLRVNPKGQVPVLLDGGTEIFDSTQIFEYIEHRWPAPPLWPQTPAQRAIARQLEHASDEVFFPHVVRLMGLRGSPDPLEAPEWKQACNGINDYYLRMEALLQGREYLAQVFTYADIAFYMAQFFAARHTVPIKAEHNNLVRWRKRMADRPAVRSVIDHMAAYLRVVGRPVPDYGV